MWQERTTYDKSVVTEWRKAIGVRKISEADLKSSKSSKTQRQSGKSKREKEKEVLSKKKKIAHSTSAPAVPVVAKVTAPKLVLPPAPAPCDGVIIDPDTLIKALQELENTASTDSSVREKIASFPPEVSDASLLEKIRDKDTAAKLSSQVDVACSMLSEYNSRLARELEDRKQVAVMLATYIKNQKDQVSMSEQKLSEYRDKLKRVSQVRNELKSHLQNLPDLSLLPSVTGGLAPLPSAGDLFNIGMGRVEHKYTSSLGSTSSASPNTASPADYESVSTPNS